MQSYYLDDIITLIIVGIICFGIPRVLTIWNIYNCFAKNPKKEKLISSLTILIGGIFMYYFAV